MRASSNEMYTSGEYFKNNPHWGVDDSEWKADLIDQLLKANTISPKEIIEIGCGAGAILECLANTYPKTTLKGYDISPYAIQLAKPRENERLSFYNEDFTQLEYIHTELLMIIDVFEHVDNFYEMLRHVKQTSNYFVFHIPLDLSCRTILKPHILLQQRESVGHIHYFSKEMVEWILHDTGYEIVDWVYTKPVVDVNPPDTFKRRVKKILRNASFNLNKDMSAKLWGSYSMMILAK